MKVKKSLPIPAAPLDYFDDGTTLYLLLTHKGSVQVVAYDANEFKPLGAFWVEESVFDNSSLVGEDCLYLITEEGVVAFDSFTGDKLQILNTGSLLPIKLCAECDRIFVLCGIPLAAGTALDTRKFCISVHDRESGERLFQTQNVMGDFFGPVADDGIWLVAGNVLYRFNHNGEVESEVDLYTNPGFDPILTKSMVIVASELGTLEVFDRSSLKPISKVLVDKNSSPPVCHHDTIYWATGKQIRQVDPSTGQFETIFESDEDVASTPMLKSDTMYFSAKGSLFSIDLPTGKVDSVKIEDADLWKPVKSHSGDIYIASHSSFHQIEA